MECPRSTVQTLRDWQLNEGRRIWVFDTDSPLKPAQGEKEKGDEEEDDDDIKQDCIKDP